MNLAPKIFEVSCTEATVEMPITGVTLTFRCSAKDSPVPTFLIEVWRGQPGGRLEDPIQISAGSVETARRMAAKAIADYRKEYATKERRWFNPTQLSLSLH